ncbi:MAG: NADH-quinone oxidoreductase subunit D [Planctomycetota bacterium]|nr:NADH-quinone oxidoreductase subunit D [Planctomycetota bacterium]
MPGPTSPHIEFEESVARDGKRKGTLLLNMGPAHPATHGVIRILLDLDGETVQSAEVEIGYLHRAFEKSCEEGNYTQAIPYTDRLNYSSPIINNVGYALAVEKLLDLKTTERCDYVRVILSEISRICDHLTCIGASAMELGAVTPFLYFMKAREFLWELIEDVSGARVTVSYVRIGGVKADLTPDFPEKTRAAFAKVREAMDDVDGLLTRNRIFWDRMANVGVISKEMAISYGITGPFLRSTGVEYDVRKANPYLVYDSLPFDVPIGENGDNYDRYLIRMEEMRQSMRIVEKALDEIPAGEVQVDLGGGVVSGAEMVDRAKKMETSGLIREDVEVGPTLGGLERKAREAVIVDDRKISLPTKQEAYSTIEGLMNHFKLLMAGHGIQVPEGEVYYPVEGANGELGFYIVSDGTDKPYRVRCRPPCFPIMASFSRLIEGAMIADIIPTFGSVNMIAGELDR